MKSDEEFNRGKAPSYYVRSTVRVGLRVHTGVSAGNISHGVLPADNSFGGADFGLNAPQGGLYSSTNDFCKFASATLNYTILASEGGHQSLVEADGDAAASWESGGKPWVHA